MTVWNLGKNDNECSATVKTYTYLLTCADGIHSIVTMLVMLASDLSKQPFRLMRHDYYF